MDNHKILAEVKILCVGLARNCEKTILADIARITDCFRNFKSVEWLIVESDSSDGTVRLLEEESRRRKLTCITMGNLRDRMPQRTERLAHCRNRYVEFICSGSSSVDADYIAIVDLDGVNDALTVQSIESCWSLAVEWDACFANQRGRYYDIWALRHNFWSPNDCFKQRAFLTSMGKSSLLSHYLSVASRMLNVPVTSDPIAVDSAFGGLGIYKKSAFEGVVYIGLGEAGEEVCEHVSAHEKMRQRGAALFINPQMINARANSHSSLWQQALRGMRRLFFKGA